LAKGVFSRLAFGEKTVGGRRLVRKKIVQEYKKRSSRKKKTGGEEFSRQIKSSLTASNSVWQAVEGGDEGRCIPRDAENQGGGGSTYCLVTSHDKKGTPAE